MADMLTAKQLSEKYFGGNISEAKLYRLAKKGGIPAVKLDGSWFYPLSVIQEWIKSESKVTVSPKTLSRYGHIRRIEA